MCVNTVYQSTDCVVYTCSKFLNCHSILSKYILHLKIPDSHLFVMLEWAAIQASQEKADQ